MEGECKRSSLHGGASSLLNRRRTSGEGGSWWARHAVEGEGWREGGGMGRQSDRTVEMALGAAMGGGSACSQQRRAGEHGRVVRCRRRGATGRGATDR
jgi:hypothetical protein